MKSQLLTILLIILALTATILKDKTQKHPESHTPNILKNTFKSQEMLEKAKLIAPNSSNKQQLPKNCLKGTSVTNCTDCKLGYYLASPTDKKIKNLCFSCKDTLKHCSQCSSKSKIAGKDLLCQDCVFPYQAAGDLKSCVRRVAFFVYISVYGAVTLVLIILTAFESKKIKAKKDMVKVCPEERNKLMGDSQEKFKNSLQTNETQLEAKK